MLGNGWKVLRFRMSFLRDLHEGPDSGVLSNLYCQIKWKMRFSRDFCSSAKYRLVKPTKGHRASLHWFPLSLAKTWIWYNFWLDAPPTQGVRPGWLIVWCPYCKRQNEVYFGRKTLLKAIQGNLYCQYLLRKIYFQGERPHIAPARFWYSEIKVSTLLGSNERMVGYSNSH